MFLRDSHDDLMGVVQGFWALLPMTHHLSWFCVAVSWVCKSSVVESRGLAWILVSEGGTSLVLKSSVVESSWIRVAVARIPEQISYY